MKKKEDKKEEKGVWGWKIMNRYEFVEIWKTPTQYVTGISYLRLHYFFDTYRQAHEKAIELLQQNSGLF